jgi:site-specific DNA recombinase
MEELDPRMKLLSLVRDTQGEINNPDEGKFRYVIYARKSTDDESKQTRSLADQILECKEFAARYNLSLGKPEVFKESESAKMSDTRPEFRKMLEAVKAGKYEGIIAWHPDRLSRNMKDAGEIIDLLDKDIIKDLKFPSFVFEKGPNSKMLLGLIFVLSKQYSDQLGENVSRGNRRSIEEGKYVNKAKHGYYKDPNQFLRPDGDNFLYIKKAFELRVQDKTLEEIVEYLNGSGYTRWTKKGVHVPCKWDKQKVYKVLNDTVYTGVLTYGKRQAVNLVSIYDFTPAVSVDDFIKMNELDKKRGVSKMVRKYRNGEGKKADLMRGIVLCAECGNPMTAGITVKKTREVEKRYFYYRCSTDGCSRKNKSVRAKVIMDDIKKFLDSKPFSSKKSYEHYKSEIEQVQKQRMVQIKSELLSLRNRKLRYEQRLVKIKEMMLEEDKETREEFKRDLDQTKRDILVIDDGIEKVERKQDATRSVPLTYPEFIELMENMGKIIASIKNMSELDFVIKKIFLNFTVSAKKVENRTLSTPFDALYELNVSNCGR